MKWLLLFLVSTNVILFIVQLKEQNDASVVNGFNELVASQNIKLLTDVDRSVGARCLVIGAIAEKSIMSEIEGYLASAEIKYELIDKVEELAPSYWVYILDDVDEDLLGSLNKLDVESYMIASGELKGRLSVGLFANIDLAQDMIETLSKVLINASFIEKKKIKKTQWISLEVEQLRNKDRLIENLKEMQINLGEIKEFFCKSIASEK